MKDENSKEATQEPNKEALKHKLDHVHKVDICRMLSMGMSYRLIISEITKKYDIDLCVATIHGYAKSKRWKKHIKKFSEIHAKNVMKIAGAQKKDRIGYLLMGINQTLRSGSNKSLAPLLKELRAEMEGDKPLIDNSSHLTINVKDMTDEQLIDFAREKKLGIPSRIAEYVGSDS